MKPSCPSSSPRIASPFVMICREKSIKAEPGKIGGRGSRVSTIHGVFSTLLGRKPPGQWHSPPQPSARTGWRSRASSESLCFLALLDGVRRQPAPALCSILRYPSLLTLLSLEGAICDCSCRHYACDRSHCEAPRHAVWGVQVVACFYGHCGKSRSLRILLGLFLLLERTVYRLERDGGDIEGAGPAILLLTVYVAGGLFCPRVCVIAHLWLGSEEYGVVRTSFDACGSLAILEASVAEVALVHDPSTGQLGH